MALHRKMLEFFRNNLVVYDYMDQTMEIESSNVMEDLTNQDIDEEINKLGDSTDIGLARLEAIAKEQPELVKLIMFYGKMLQHEL